LEGFVEFVAKSLVDYPDDVKVCSETTADGKMIKIICLAEDRGKIIGKKGKTIMALRALVAGAAGRTRERISVEVPDDVETAKG
ncbi:MAG: KH domain-containing protein, partial [Lentisphaeria bacterium]|nr:KH domain-containing protein [Lentisphaeria bacterium]